MCTLAWRAKTPTPVALMWLGDVNLAAVLGAHRVPVEFKIAVVDAQHARALAHNRLAAALDHGAGDAGDLAPSCAAAAAAGLAGAALML